VSWKKGFKDLVPRELGQATTREVRAKENVLSLLSSGTEETSGENWTSKEKKVKGRSGGVWEY